ncbi:MAG: ABC transporter permease [Gammaproteobacteria bacterium]|nr:ABC transporter permease [Gammaproteobacteria bacterium]
MTEHVDLEQSYFRRVVRDTFVRLSARIGIAWVAVLVFFAVFAPFIANSHPLLLSQEGELSSPLLNYLTAADVVLILGFFISLIIFMLKRLSRARRGWLAFASLLILTVLANLFIKPPELAVYEQYRNAERAGEYDWVLHTPIPYSPRDYLRDSGDTGLEAPFESEARLHLFGTEANGADLFSRMIHASRIALGIGFVATGIAMFIGVIIGGLMGYFSGWVDMIGMRLVEIFEAVPTLFLLLTFVAFFGRSLYIMMVIIGITSWSSYARYIRAEFLRLRQQDYVQAAVAGGLPLRSILFRHMLPNGIAPILVAASFGVASAILAEAVLSFLGLGLVDEPSWGQMLNQAVQSSSFYWWMAAFPGGAIFLTVFAYNLMGEALRDAIDPYLKRGG